MALPDLGASVPWNDDLREVLELLEEEARNWAARMKCEGMRTMAAVVAEERFSAPVAEEIAAGLESISGPKRLVEIAKLIWLAPNEQAVLSRIRAS